MTPDDYPKVWPKQHPKSLTVPKTTLWYNLEVAAARYPDKPITLFYDSRVSYRELLRQAERLAGFLQQRCGVRRGDRVLLDLQNSPQFMLAYYAILRADAVVVPVSPMNVTEELEHYVADSGATTAVIAQDLYAHFRPLMGRALTHAIVATYSDALTEPTSTRCTTLWVQAAAPRLGVDTVLGIARNNGYELDFLRGLLTERVEWHSTTPLLPAAAQAARGRSL